MGVITTSRLEAGEKFGPVPPTLTLAEPTVLIGHRTCDTLPDIHTVKLNVHCYSSGEHLAEWIPYVLSARCPAEQNMEATLFEDGLLYFCVTRNVDNGSELLIWYSDQLAQLLRVPELDSDWIAGEMYRCPDCGEKFLYPNCLRAHLRFRCRYRKQDLKPSGCRLSGPRHSSGNLPPSSDDAGVGKMADAANGTRPQQTTKRKAGDGSDDDLVADQKRRSSPTDVMSRVSVDPRPGVFDSRAEKMNEFAGATQLLCRSAFQRVDKLPSGLATPPSPSQAISSSSPSDVASVASPLPLSVITSSAFIALESTSGSRHAVPNTSGLYMIPPPMHTERAHRPLMMNAGFVACNNSIPETLYPRIGEESIYARRAVTNNNNNGTGNDVKLLNRSAMGVAVDPALTLSLPVPGAGGYRTTNPVVEKLLQLVSSPRPDQSPAKSVNGVGAAAALSTSFPSLQLAQNWCAKCNTSFRMTSDLVYHMRTQHKRDLDPTSQGRRKDDGKLRCDVCGESFKERHHLTRHMTSHT